MVLCFAPFGFFPLTFVCLVPLLLATAEAGPLPAAAAGGAAGVVASGIGYGAALGALGQIQGREPVAVLPIYGLFVVFHAVRWSLVALAWRAYCFRSPGCLAALPVAAAWVVLEWGYPQIMPWELGSALGPAARLRQSADLFGVYGLSFLAVLVNALLAQALGRLRRRSCTALAPAAGAASVALLMLSYGEQAAPAGPRVPFTVDLVQGGLRARARELAAANSDAWAVYAGLSCRRGRGAVDLVVWPESVLRIYLGQNPAWRARVAALAAESGAPLLLGALDLAGDGRGELNSAYLVPAVPTVPGEGGRSAQRRGNALQVYHKRALVPFAEAVPRWWAWPWPTTGEFVAGGGARTFELRVRGRTVRLAPSICYEAIFPGWFNALVRDGADVLVNQTDDSWFGAGAGPAQHLEMTRLRAVETRRWLLRASGSGISALIDPRGELVASLPLGARGVLRGQVEGSSKTLTPYVRYGDWIVTLSFAIVALRYALLARAGGSSAGMAG